MTLPSIDTVLFRSIPRLECSRWVVMYCQRPLGLTRGLVVRRISARVRIQHWATWHRAHSYGQMYHSRLCTIITNLSPYWCYHKRTRPRRSTHHYADDWSISQRRFPADEYSPAKSRRQRSCFSRNQEETHYINCSFIRRSTWPAAGVSIPVTVVSVRCGMRKWSVNKFVF